MPIPISEIPNAPQAGNGPVLSGVPNLNTNLSGAAQQLNIAPLRQGAFDAPAQGAQAIGYNLGKLGEQGDRIASVISDARERKQLFQDEVTLATINRRREEEFATYQGTTQDKPESEWLPGWQKHFSEVDSKLNADLPPLSERGQQRLAVDTQQFLTRTNTTLISSSTRSAVERGSGELAAQAQRQFDSGDDEGGHATVSKLVTTGAWRQDQADNFLKQVDHTRNQNQLTAAMQQNPKLFLEDIQDFIKTGKSEVLDGNFKGPDKAIQLQKWQGIAEQNLRSIQSDQRQSLFEGIQSGEISNEDQILSTVKDGGDVLGPKDIQAARKSLMNQVGPLDPVKFNDLQVSVAAYDKKSDPTGEVKADLQRDIAMNLPTQEASALFHTLNGLSKDKTPDQQVNGFVQSHLKELHEEALKSKFPDSESRNDPTFLEAQKKDALDLAKQIDAWKAYQGQHPNASNEDGVNWISTQTLPDRQTHRAWYQVPFDAIYNIFHHSPTLPAPADALKVLDSNPSETQPKAGMPQTSQYTPIDSHTVKEVTAYRPGATSSMGLKASVEGGNVDASGNPIVGSTTMEDYQAGNGNYVTVAMDSESEWQGKYLTSPKFPGVVFKVADNGGHGNGKTGRNWIDIAYTNPENAKTMRLHGVDFHVISTADARKISKSRGQS